MKKIIWVFYFILSFQFLAFAEEKPTIVATASMIADMCKNIVGDKIDVKCIVPIGGDPHIYEPTPSDARLVLNADMILLNGLTFEGWLNELVEFSGTKAEQVLVTAGVAVIGSDKYKNSTDPHAWMDASNGLIYIKNIKEAAIRLDPKNKTTYEENYQKYRQEITSLDQEIKAKMETVPEGKRILITSHDAFQYYGKRYGIRLEAILGTSTDAQAQTQDISRIIRTIKESKIPAVFVESTINPKMLQQIADDTNVRVGGELFADSLGDKNSDAPTYIEMLRHNTNTIVSALKATGSESQKASEHRHQTPNNTSSNYLMYGVLALLFLGGFAVVFSKLNK